MVIKMDKKTDLRIIKTKKALYESLLDLMKEQTFEEIKVSEICTNALVNRSTFYAHYNDKYELLVALLNDLKLNLLASLKRNENEINTKEYFMKMLELLINHIDEKRKIYSAILTNNRNGILMDILFDVADKDIKERIEDNKQDITKDIPAEIITKFYLGAIINIGIEWIRDNSKYKKEDILKYFAILIPEKI